MELRTYLQAFRRRWRLVALSFVIVLVGATLWTAQSTREYTSTARLFISTPTSDSGGVDAYQGSLFSQQRVASYADLITGKALTQRVVDRLGLTESAAALSHQVTSKVVSDTVLLDVTVTDPDPLRARLLAATVADEFTRYVPSLETPPGGAVSPIKATVVDTAELATTPVSPRPVRNICLAAVLGLLLGLLLAVVRESLDNTVKTSHEVTLATGSSLLGHVPFDSQATGSPLITDLEPHAPRVEATRMLHTNLQFVDVDKSSTVFVVTSSVPEEGKTTTAINLAIASSRTGQSVLLLEGDLRRPRIAQYLRLDPTVGLTTLLVGRIGIDEAIQTWGHDGLDVITSGSKPPNPAELVQTQVMASTLEALRERYDVIIVDAPPLLPVTDGAILASQADGAILIVRQGKTTKDQLAQATQHLAAVEAKLLGVVLNMTRQRAANGYSYGYRYGYSYGEHSTRHPWRSKVAADAAPMVD